VRSNTRLLGSEFLRDPEDLHSVVVDKYMQTSVVDVYAAGDCCSCLSSVESIYNVTTALMTGTISPANAVGDRDLRSVAEELYPVDMASPAHWFQMRLWTQARNTFG
jgi:pyruvate/2-oxoglutarate dehydrogenase complex dihydrolipoamide dehydrogenase (E3) component